MDWRTNVNFTFLVTPQICWLAARWCHSIFCAPTALRFSTPHEYFICENPSHVFRTDKRKMILTSLMDVISFLFLYSLLFFSFPFHLLSVIPIFTYVILICSYHLNEVYIDITYWYCSICISVNTKLMAQNCEIT